MSLRAGALLLGIVSLAAEGRDPIRAVFSDDGQAILEGATRITLYSLNPVAEPLFSFRRSRKATFRGYRVIGSTEIAGAAKTELTGKLYSALAEDVTPARCFVPHHGIRAEKGDRSIDLVMCFECRQIESYINGRKGGGTIGTSAEAYFNEALRAAGIALSRQE